MLQSKENIGLGLQGLLVLGLVVLDGIYNAHGTEGTRVWTKQTGSVTHPKLPQYFPNARIGEVFAFDNGRYMSKFTGQVEGNEPNNDQNHKKEHNQQLWTKLEHGTFIWPKVLSPDDSHATVVNGDVLFDPVENVYYVFQRNKQATSDVDQMSRISIADVQSSDLARLEYKQDWMGLLRPVIGDRRFGDIVVPGTHDSGSWGIREDSYLVSRDYFTYLMYNITPATQANWSLTQPTSLLPHLDAGFRNLDMRVVDMIEENDTFYWWHNMAAEPIFDGLAEIRDFAAAHSEEIIFIFFQHFVAPGDGITSTIPISVPRKHELAGILIDYLGDYMVPKANLSDNPTINEILATGRNIIAEMKDEFIQTNYNEYFWPVVVVSDWVGMTNPEELFLDRSSKAERFLLEHPDQITDLSGCNTPGSITRLASNIRTYRHYENVTAIVENITEIIDSILPPDIDVEDIPEPEQMSFEGLFVDLQTMTKTGTNTQGMFARPAENYTNGGSVHYRGTNTMLPYWIARPQRYKTNIFYVDDFPTSTAVDTAISANRGDIPRQVTIAFQGNPKDGYLVWSLLEAYGGRDGLACTATLARYVVGSSMFDLGNAAEWMDLPVRSIVDISEGEYPPDAVVRVQVSSNAIDWYDVFEGHIQSMIDETFDVYLRSTDLGNGAGFAYVSKFYNAFSENCHELPRDNYLNIVQWL